MVIEDLSNEIEKHLPNALEIYVAVALAREKPLDNLLNFVDNNSVLKVLVGIDLPTSIEALELLKTKTESNENFEAKIFYDDVLTFHPKVYLIKNKDNWMAFIGSANLTEGGLNNNIELSYLVTNQEHCIEIFKWFDSKFKESFPIDEFNISQYRNQIDLNTEKKVEKKKLKFRKTKLVENPLDNIDFSDRYFKKEHHWAFRKELWLDNSLAANKERQETENRFIELHKVIYPQFYSNGLKGLHPNKDGNIVSRHHQINELAPRRLNAMWLSYGKSQAEIKTYQGYFTDKDQRDLQTFIHHARLQIRIELQSIGIWILFGKENKGSIFDRDYFKNKMTEIKYRNDFFQKIKSLPKEYWITVNDIRSSCNSFNTADELYDFCKKDNIDKYFIIGRDYQITDTEMSESNLPTETLNVFKILFPLYEMMRHRL